MKYKVIKIDSIYKIYRDSLFLSFEAEVDSLDKAEKYIFGLNAPKQPEKIQYSYSA